MLNPADPFAVRLAEKLDGLPLALATAGAYLNQLSISLQDYLRYYEESWSILQQESPELLSYEDRTMYTTWNLSYLHVKSLSFAAAELFRLWAYFDNQDLWFEMLASGKRNAPEWFSEMCSQEIYFNKAARILSEHALIEPLVSSNGYGMHGCVHSWTKYVLGAKQDQIFTKLATECVGLSVPDKTVPEYWKIEKRLIPHAKQVKEHLDACLQGKVFSDEETLHALHNMGLLYRDQDKIEEAEAMYQRALTGYEKVWGPEHIRTLVTVFNLGIIYKGQGRKGEAEVMYQRALTGFQKVGGPEHLLTLDAVSCLANLYKATGKMEEAEIMYKRALTGFQKVGGPEHTATLHTVNNLGNLYNLQGKMEEAEAMYRRALTGYERTLGPEHISTLTTVNNLGGLYLYQGKIKKAEAMYQRALTGKENVWGPEHTSTLNTVNNLGSLYRGQGEAEKAEAMYQRALTGYKKVFGLKHGSTLAAVHNLIVLYRDQGRIEEAKAMFRRALD
jgi:tetratricopeptide (TPR) repeat protein